MQAVQVSTLSEQLAFFSRRERKRTRARDLVAIGMLFAALAFQLSIRIAVVERSYDIEQLRKEALRNDTVLRELEFAYALRTRPQTLSERAKSVLGFGPLAGEQVRLLPGFTEVTP